MALGGTATKLPLDRPPRKMRWQG